MGYSKKTDEKWQKKWKDTEIYNFDESKVDKKYYLLEMFSYPSGKNLHIGHWWNYGLCDSFGRLKRMQGYELFHPPGFDAFGLPAENYAIKTGVHPSISTENNIKTMEKQFKEMGTTYDWNYEITTCNPDYYKWTQWLFLKLYEKGLAYRKEAPVNWCPSCMTVLANEQVVQEKCERCETKIQQKSMTQWFFKITSYAEELLKSLKDLDWSDTTKKIQENWIGKSIGAEIVFKTGNENITVFTTRPETIMGVTFIVLSPEHPLVNTIATDIYKQEVKEYVNKTTEKTGVFTGAFAEHPVTKKLIPIWIADYVLISYGTGAIMAVPAHDERDNEFALKYNLPIISVISEKGTLTNSGSYTGLSVEEAKEQITSDYGKPEVKYRLRDWLVSRQRYWGCPIPIVYCKHCGIVPVNESDLPVALPYNVEFMPRGKSPLTTSNDFVNTTCPKCGKQAKRDTDTLDTFVCSSWYYLRFYDNKETNMPFNKERLEKIMPVDKYIGGIEHATMHLLYSRFITKALRDMGYLSFGEPFPSLIHQGIILGNDGKKMSKRNGAVSPDLYIEQYGSDVFRMYLGFGFSYLDGGPWDDNGIIAINRFVNKIYNIVDCFKNNNANSTESAEIEYIRNYTIKQVTENISNFCFNTAIARIMEYTNAIQKYQQNEQRDTKYEESLIRDLILLLAPLAPHLTEELWEAMGYEYSVHNQPYPVCDKTKLNLSLIEIAVQVNGKLKDVLKVNSNINEAELKRLALQSNKVIIAINDKPIKKVIYIKNRILNIVC